MSDSKPQPPPLPPPDTVAIDAEDRKILRQKYMAQSSLLLELGAQRTSYLRFEQEALKKLDGLREEYGQAVSLLAERYLSAQSYPEGVYELDLDAGAFVRRQE